MPAKTNRNFSVEIEAARKAQDWEAHSRIWDERRRAEVLADEARLEASLAAEVRIVRKLVDDALALGYSVGVFDGEETVVKRSRDVVAIMAAIGSTDEDRLLFHTSDGVPLGWVHLIWGNGTDVIADNSDRPAINDLVLGAEQLAGEGI